MKCVKIMLIVFCVIGISLLYLLDKEVINKNKLIEKDIEEYSITIKKIEEYNTFLTGSNELMEEYKELNNKISELEEEKSKLEEDIKTVQDKLDSLS